MLQSLKLYDNDNAVILETGFNLVKNGDETHTVHLKDEERVFEYSSAAYPNYPSYAWH